MRLCAPLPSNPAILAVRPLLGERKETLMQYAREHGIAFSEDATNASLDILRNRIRHELIPLLAAQYQPGLLQTVPRLMEIAAAEGELIGGLARQWLEAPGAQAFAQLPLALQRQCLRAQLLEQGIEADFERVEWLRLNPERPLPIAPDAAALRDSAGKVRRVHQPDGEKHEDWNESEPLERVLGLSGQCEFAGLQISWEIADVQGAIFERRAGCEHFDAGKIGRNIALRHWKPGDRFQPIGAPSPVKLQDLFVNSKAPRALRHQRVVALTEGGEIFWVEGLRISERFKLDKTTARRLKWQWRR
jgi:tRNA(Ile)-lysidine synthase